MPVCGSECEKMASTKQENQSKMEGENAGMMRNRERDGSVQTEMLDFSHILQI